LYYIKEGLTRVGSPEANLPQDIQLVGAHILSEHCIFENSEGIVKLIPSVSNILKLYCISWFNINNQTAQNEKAQDLA